MFNHTKKHTEKCFVFLFLAPYARTTRYEIAFLLEGKKSARSLRSLGLASLLFERSEFLIDTPQKEGLRVCLCARRPRVRLILALVWGRQTVYGQNTVNLLPV